MRSNLGIPSLINGHRGSAASKEDVCQQVINNISALGLKIAHLNSQKPWGISIAIDPSQTKHFLDIFFRDIQISKVLESAPLSPKFLIFAPWEMLSWQYHQRRSELWKVICGPIGVYTSKDDLQPKRCQIYTVGTLAAIPQGMRHRGAGLKNWGMVAEIWQHTNQNNLSNEEDIVRLDDKYQRR